MARVRYSERIVLENGQSVELPRNEQWGTNHYGFVTMIVLSILGGLFIVYISCRIYFYTYNSTNTPPSAATDSMPDLKNQAYRIKTPNGDIVISPEPSNTSSDHRTSATDEKLEKIIKSQEEQQKQLEDLKRKEEEKKSDKSTDERRTTKPASHEDPPEKPQKKVSVWDTVNG